MAIEREIIVFRQFAEKLVKDIGQSIDSSGVSASGNLKDSLDFRIQPNRLTVFAAPYAKAVEVGRGPSQKAGGDLRGAIRKWIDDKGIIPDGITKDSLAFLITRKIHNDGTRLFRSDKDGPDAYGRSKPSQVIEGVVQDGRLRGLREDLIKTYVSQIRTLLTQ